MKKSRISIHFILGLFLLGLLAAGGCGGGSDAPIPGSYTISGTVTGVVTEGVAIHLSGAAVAPTITDADGNYSFTVPNGTYTVIPVLAGYTFDPVSTAVTVSGASQTGIDFVATANSAETYSISGTVTGAVQAGVTITLSGDATGTTATLEDGSYIFPPVPAGSYTVTPSSPPTDYTFDPASIDVTIVNANIIDQDFAATLTFAQADLGGTWNVNIMKPGSSFGWQRIRIEVDPITGVASCLSMSDSEGATECPDTYDLTLTIDPATGVITQSGADAVDDGHMTMTLNKNFAAGTGTTGEDTHQLAIFQKVDPDVTYSMDDLKNKSIALHAIIVLTNAGDPVVNWWSYGEGNIDNDGGIAFASVDSPYAADGPVVDWEDRSPILVDETGTVTFWGEPMGFLSADKKTIVMIISLGDEGIKMNVLGIFQITEPTFTLGPIPISAGTYASHAIGVQDDFSSDFWLHSLFSVDSVGKSSIIDWVVAPTELIPEPTGDDYIAIISPTGTVRTSLNNSYHGQMSGDGMFIVGTQTKTIYDEEDEPIPFYSLRIDMRTNGAVPAEAE